MDERRLGARIVAALSEEEAGHLLAERAGQEVAEGRQVAGLDAGEVGLKGLMAVGAHGSSGSSPSGSPVTSA